MFLLSTRAFHKLTEEPARMRGQRQVDQRRGVKETAAEDFNGRHEFVVGRRREKLRVIDDYVDVARQSGSHKS